VKLLAWLAARSSAAHGSLQGWCSVKPVLGSRGRGRAGRMWYVMATGLVKANHGDGL